MTAARNFTEGGMAGGSPDAEEPGPESSASRTPAAEPTRAAEAPSAPPAPAASDEGKRRVGRSGPPATTARKAAPAEPKMAPAAGSPAAAADTEEPAFEATRAETLTPPMPRPRPAESSERPTLTVSLPSRSEE